jgi:hypothetical protein
MKRYTILVTLLLFLALLALAVTQTGTAGNDVTSLLNNFDLSWWTVDGGGATAVTGGAYSLGGTVGQADTAVLSGGNYNLAGGFWSGAGESLYGIYLPVTVR